MFDLTKEYPEMYHGDAEWIEEALEVVAPISSEEQLKASEHAREWPLSAAALVVLMNPAKRGAGFPVSAFGAGVQAIPAVLLVKTETQAQAPAPVICFETGVDGCFVSAE